MELAEESKEIVAVFIPSNVSHSPTALQAAQAYEKCPKKTIAMMILKKLFIELFIKSKDY
ncbi:hypothetical protein GW830_03305 [bacterium]|nr:hypothetical protein [bacterium]